MVSRGCSPGDQITLWELVSLIRGRALWPRFTEAGPVNSHRIRNCPRHLGGDWQGQGLSQEADNLKLFWRSRPNWQLFVWGLRKCFSQYLFVGWDCEGRYSHLFEFVFVWIPARPGKNVVHSQELLQPFYCLLLCPRLFWSFYCFPACLVPCHGPVDPSPGRVRRDFVTRRALFVLERGEGGRHWQQVNAKHW